MSLIMAKGSAPFRPHARLLHLLGDELISDESIAVIELVKNAYDADARTVSVELERITGSGEARIIIQDDGDGMDLDTLLHGWLEPATRRKRRGGRKQPTARGRYPLGEKGVGRFAVNKLGSELELVTRARGAEHEVALTVRWDIFGDGFLDEIENHYEVRLPVVFGEQRHGTWLNISGTRTVWDRGKVVRLRDGLARLISPLSSMDDFQIVLSCTEFPDLGGQVTSSLLEQAPYRLVGQVDESGIFQSQDSPDGPVDLRRLAPEAFLEEGRYRLPVCGPFQIALSAWDLDNVGLHRAAMDRTMRATLRRHCGVSLYRDGFRVMPYGGPGDYWLELNQRRVNNPTMRVSTNQVVGTVEITQEHNPDLQDRTSREGLIDTPALHDLKSLLVAALAFLEERRFAARQAAAPAPSSDEEPDPILQILRQARSRGQAGSGAAALLDRAISAYRQKNQEQAKQRDFLLRLAATGRTAEQIGASMGGRLTEARTALRTARNRLAHDAEMLEVEQLLAQIESTLLRTTEDLDLLASLNRMSDVALSEGADVRAAFRAGAEVFEHRLREATVQVVLESPEPLTVAMPAPALLQVILHLIENSLQWLLHVPVGERMVRVHIQRDPAEFIIADSGPGISPDCRKQVFQPFFSTRSMGYGLGLHFVAEILRRHGASIELLDTPRLLPGANFRVSFGELG